MNGQSRSGSSEAPGCVDPAPQPVWKRSLDVVSAAILILISAPVVAIVAVLVLKFLGRPVLFRQRRAGLGGTVFEILKFRTMTDERDDNNELLPNPQRRHPFGEKLRSTSLDELPALINVLQGHMSMVGPRPLLTSYLDRYSPTEAQRHRVKPGITGLAQVMGRNSVSWDEKFAYDLEYIESMSLRGDVRLMLRTFLTVIRREGADGNVLMQEFMGASEPED